MTEQITYNGKQYPIRVGYYALKHTAREIKDNSGKEIGITDIMSDDITVLEPLLFHSMVMGARLEKKELDITRDEAEFVLDECFTEFLKIVPRFFKTTIKGEPESLTPQTEEEKK